jgi:hypothetical protein
MSGIQGVLFETCCLGWLQLGTHCSVAVLPCCAAGVVLSSGVVFRYRVLFTSLGKVGVHVGCHVGIPHA